jgi:predicted flap endonuclease-1-like 5' DNA nuclease
MNQTFHADWIVLAVVAILAVLIAWWLFARATRTTRVRSHRPDVLDAGAAPAQRNQALIDSPAAAAIVPPTTVDVMGGLGEIMAAGAHEEAVNAEAQAWEDREREQDAAAAAAAPAPAAAGDDLTRIKGLGPKLAAALQAMGVTSFAQIAAWDDAAIDRADAALPPAFRGRIRRDAWVDQAGFLAGGDTAGYEAKFGKL